MIFPAWIPAGILGLILGSFVNVLVHRLPREKSIISPASHCPDCQTPIRWFYNIPVVGYLILGGRCSQCRRPISPRYPMIEVLTGLLFIACVQNSGLNLVTILRGWPLMVLFVTITFIDLEHRIIPDVLSISGVVMGILTSWMVPELGWVQSILGAGFGFAFFYFLAWIYYARTGQSGLGGGDIKFLAMIGAFLGPSGVITTVLISSVTGSIVGVLWALASRQGRVMKLAIPYGPFLVIGALCYYFWGEGLWLRFMNPM